MASIDKTTDAIEQRVYLTCPAKWFDHDSRPHGFEFLQGRIRIMLSLPDEGWSVLGDPTGQWSLCIPGAKPAPPTATEVVQLLFTQRSALDAFFIKLRDFADDADAPRAGADPVMTTADYWCPITGNETFLDRASALQQIGAVAIQDLRGAGVNVVIVDRGVNKDDVVPPAKFGGGWCYTANVAGAATVLPGSAQGEQAEHSGMLIRNILAIAPEVMIFDMPLIPPNIGDIPSFLAGAQAAFQQMWSDIASMRADPRWRGPWLLVNAWATFDLRSDLPPGDPGRYADDPAHPFHTVIEGLAGDGQDLVFCAGNCGQWCPDDRCGPGDIGFGRSISGANAYAEVLSVGAVRVDGLPLGYSSQGPGMIAADKPDLCAPANFADDHDPGRINAGTSAACAVAAGVVAALRSPSPTAPMAAVTPAALITALKKGAGHAACDAQLGFGILDASATRGVLGIPPRI
ncbi:MAG: S8 family serine peptidase [Acetobacteraceae bacterium]